MIGGKFLFDDFNKSSLATSLTEKQIVAFKSTLLVLLFKFNNNSDITLQYLADNLTFLDSSAKMSIDDNRSMPFIHIEADFMLETTLINVKITVSFNSAYCFIPLTYSDFKLHIQKTESSGLFKVLNLYKPDVGFSYFYFGSFRDDSICTITTRDVFKFQNLITTNPRKFYIEYILKKDKLISSKIVNDDTDEYFCYDNKLLPVEEETLFIHFANAAYTRHSEFVNSYVKNRINFSSMKCFAELKKIFLDIYKSENRETLLNELVIYQMIDI